MDINLIRSIVTVLAFVVFVLLVIRVWRSANREQHAQAAALPFADEPNVAKGHEQSQGNVAPPLSLIPTGDGRRKAAPLGHS